MINYDNPIFKFCAQKLKYWSEKGSGSVILYGGTGCGKTMLSTELAVNQRGGVITEVDYFRQYQSDAVKGKPEIFRRWLSGLVKGKKFVVFDDLGVGRPDYVKNDEGEFARWYEAAYWQLFDYCDSGVRFIITTNLDREKTLNRIGSRGWSRLAIGGDWVDMSNVDDFRLSEKPRHLIEYLSQEEAHTKEMFEKWVAENGLTGPDIQQRVEELDAFMYRQFQKHGTDSFAVQSAIMEMSCS